MKNIISYSLWGNNPKYCVGAIRNVELAKKIYPDFKCRFYVDLLVPTSIIIQLEDLGAETIDVPCIGDYKGMFWRMNCINDFDIVLIRDCDSRLSLREKYCVDEFLHSDKSFHSIHDHPFHQFHVMPGLMAFKRSTINFKTLLNQFKGEDRYGIDYEFYSSIFPLIEKDLFIHDDFFGRGKKINIKRNGLEFCGKIFDHEDKTVLEHEEALRKYLNK
jgi:hypothetical protein